MSSGLLYVAGNSASLPVTVSISVTNELEIYCKESQKLLHSEGAESLKVKSKIANLPREITLPNKDFLSVDACSDIDDWLYKKGGKKVDLLEKNIAMVLFSIVAIPVTLYGVFKYLIPVMAINFANLVPDYASRLASEHTLMALDKSVLSESEIDIEVRENFIESWNVMASKLEVTHSSFNLNFRSSEFLGANAFALPDGTIVVTDQLVELLEKDEALLSAIMLHEIGHVEHKHSMRLIAEMLATSLAIDYFIGDFGAVIELFAGMATTVTQNQFSQEHEWEADNFALSNIERVGLSKEHFAKALEKLASQHGDSVEFEQLMSSHPMTQARIDNARNQAGQ